MREEWIQRRADLLALPRHHVDRVMQKSIADFRGRFRHENTCPWLAPHQHRQRADVILMGVRDQDCFDFPIGDRFEIGQRILAGVLWMHSAIEHEPVTTNLDII